MQWMPTVLVTALSLTLTATALAAPSTHATPSKPQPTAPTLVIGEGAQQQSLGLSQAQIDVQINGPLSQTTMVLTFKNDQPRVLEGEINFPLPEGATVSGYGLDVNGVLVDGVPVSKEKARVTFEKEVRRGVDPGIAEQTKGNNFRTRVYPIPANGTRTVRIQYVSDLTPAADGSSLQVPLNWGEPIANCTLNLTIANVTGEPAIRGIGKLDLKHSGTTWTAQQTFKNVTFDGDLLVTLPTPAGAQVIVEKRLRQRSIEALRQDPKPEHYFAIFDRPAPAIDQLSPIVSHIGILWDASLSRLSGAGALTGGPSNTGHERELALIRKLAATLGNGTIDVTVFRDVPEATVSFAVDAGKADQLIDYLAHVTYDGGTNFGALQVPAKMKNGPAYGYWLLFTDGLADLGPDQPALVEAPIFTIATGAQADFALLHRIAETSGGQAFNLARATDEQILAAMRQQPFILVSAEYNPDQVAEVYPKPGAPVLGQFAATGRLLAPSAKIKLNFGYGKSITQSLEYTLKQDDAGETGLVPRLWAGRKIADLSVDVEKNADGLLAIGKEFNLVTPNTSLIVLERVEQYVQYGIVPPQNQPALYQEFLQLIETNIAQEKTLREGKIEHVLALWNQRVQWWEAKHEYPKDFHYKEVPEPVAAGGGGGGASFGLTGATAADRPRNAPGAVAPSMAPAPPALPPASTPTADALADSHGTTGRRALSPEDTRAPVARQRELRDAANGGAGSGGGLFAADSPAAVSEGRKADSSIAAGGPTIAIKEWNPQTPYLAAMKKVPAEKAYDVYLAQRAAYRASPAFYLDCADYLLRHNQHALGLRVLTNIAELKLEDAGLLRIVAYRLTQIGEADLAIDLFTKVKQMRPEEPQSYRDLALALADRAALEQLAVDNAYPAAAAADYARALALLNKVVMQQWDRFDEIEVIALMEANAILAKVKRLPDGGAGVPNPLDARLVKLLDLDVRIALTWDADATDIDLWVTEPSGEKCLYSHNRTTIGGLLSHDFTQGYGPEEYCLRHALPGAYKIEANFYGSSQQKIAGPCTVQATVITNFGRPDEKRQALTLRLTTNKEVVSIGTIKIGG